MNSMNDIHLPCGTASEQQVHDSYRGFDRLGSSGYDPLGHRKYRTMPGNEERLCRHTDARAPSNAVVNISNSIICATAAGVAVVRAVVHFVLGVISPLLTGTYWCLSANRSTEGQTERPTMRLSSLLEVLPMINFD